MNQILDGHMVCGKRPLMQKFSNIFARAADPNAIVDVYMSNHEGEGRVYSNQFLRRLSRTCLGVCVCVHGHDGLERGIVAFS